MTKVGHVSAVQSAVTRLNAALAADATGVSPQHTVPDAEAALSSAASTAAEAATQTAKAEADVASLVKSADALMSKARRIRGSGVGHMNAGSRVNGMTRPTAGT